MPEDLDLSHRSPLGRLKRVEDLRTAWPGEAKDFTPWLARDENISILAETLGMELEVEAKEKGVGPFRADILCRAADPDQESWVLIENQLEKTDHIHLGQLMTYAAGLHTATIVWIAQPFQDEHRAALDWLNEITDKRFRFFGIELELWKIGESLPAPKFTIVSKPNKWTKEAGEQVRQAETGALSPLKQQQKRYWEDLTLEIERRNNPVKIERPQAKHWSTSRLGRVGFHLSASINSRKPQIHVALNLTDEDAKSYFHLLKEEQENRENELGVTSLDWMELPNQKESRIIAPLSDADPTDENDWPRQHTWLADTLVRFDEVFRPIVHELDATDWQPDDEPDEDDPAEMGQEP